MKSLFDAISTLDVSEDFSIHFQSMNLNKGWKLMEELDCSDMVKNLLVKYVAFCYSYESPLLKKKRERLENKLNVCNYLELEVNDFVLECVQNANTKFNKYISWYLRESQDRDFALLISAEDLYFELLEVSRNGIEKVVIAKDEKTAEKVMKMFGRVEINEKAKAYEQAMKVKASMESQERQLEKNYEYLHKTLKNESNEFANSLGWAERQVLKRKNQ